MGNDDVRLPELPILNGELLDQAANLGLLLIDEPLVHRDVKIALYRYFTWQVSGRKADPWASGGARSSWSAGDRVKGSSPGSRPPVAAIEPEPDSELVAIEQTLAALPAWQCQLAEWKSYGDGDGGKALTNEQCAERLGRGVDVVKDRWAEVASRVHFRMHRLVTSFDQPARSA